jgi:hypothetical protein
MVVTMKRIEEIETQLSELIRVENETGVETPVEVFEKLRDELRSNTYEPNMKRANRVACDFDTLIAGEIL